MMESELEEIQNKILEGKERELSSVELLACILGNCSRGESSVAIAMDLLSYFGGWDGLFQATHSELEDFKNLKTNQIDMVLILGKFEKIMKIIEP